jgi:Protein of unknown function (DUF2934)
VTDSGKSIEDRVRERAYSLWEQDGRRSGRSDDYWRQARSEVEAEEAEPGNEAEGTEKKAVSTSTAPPKKPSG